MKFLLSLLTLISALTVKADIANEGIYLRIVDDADAALKAGDFARAEKLYTEAMDLQPENPGNILLMSNLGMVRFYMGQDSLALVTLDRAHSIAPRSTTILNNRARVRLVNGLAAEALEDYNLVIEIAPNQADPYFYRGMIELSGGMIKQAEEDFATLEKLDPDGENTQLARARLLVIQQQYGKAIPYLNRLITKEKSSDYLASRALCNLMTGNLGEAAEDIADGIELDPNDGMLYLYRALLNKQRYQTKQSKLDGQRAIELGVNPKTVESFLK
ncbi:MAG: tetratricopeptide repeat protein [Muribaculaceae bacterium]|nr:tetratricopeptide repeat protein [Muribaculaceae bacterium]MDE6643648.1 tetratricopeptide repeat protein [Muribaculaceae bacterium]